jgi:hypothetical protein
VTFVPDARNARVDPRKLIYLVTSQKAGFFIAHGFDPGRPEEWIAALRQHPVRNRIENVFPTAHGVKYTVRCTLPSPNGRNPCAFTVWMVDAGQSEPRFVTGYASPLSAGAPTEA